MSGRIDGPSLAALDALGLLDEAGRLELEQALAASPDLREELQDLYEVAAAFPRALPLEAPSSSVRERIAAHAADEHGHVGHANRSSRSAISEALHFIHRDEGWQPHPIPGITVKMLSVDPKSGVATLLIKAAPGTTYPAHHHSGPEGCYVIEGEVLVAGRRIGAGDFHLADADSDHDPLYTETGATVLLVCAAADYI
jgi:quercetin dioxygenase-like cupin family protein